MVKKLTKLDRGPCEPEFIIMSRRPGIGARVADAIAEDALKSGLWFDEYGDIVSTIKVGMYSKGLGGYMTRRIRSQLTGDNKVPFNKREAYHAKVHALQEAAQENGEKPHFAQDVRALQIEQKFKLSRANETF